MWVTELRPRVCRLLCRCSLVLAKLASAILGRSLQVIEARVVLSVSCVKLLMGHQLGSHASLIKIVTFSNHGSIEKGRGSIIICGLPSRCLSCIHICVADSVVILGGMRLALTCWSE